MINFALCFLAYGDEHITELNSIGNTLSNYPTFVLTDDKTKIKNKSINVIETTEDFNFNLKRYSVKEAFRNYDTIVMLDTDVNIQSLSFVSEITSDGMYVEWVDPKLTHKGFRMDSKNNEYLIELSKLNNHKLPIQFIPEFCVVIKISDIDKRIQFVERWGEVHNSVKQFEPTDRHYNLNGAIEGCIMYLTCMDLDIPIIPYSDKLQIIHYTSYSKIDKKII
jgi:lipopolysaccharide biosynthesis glycosyltransferase